MTYKKITFLAGALFVAFSMMMAAPAAAHAETDNGLVGRWNFDEGSGGTAYDSSGYGNNATIGGTTAWSTTGLKQGALSFDGTTTFARVATFNNTPSSNMTLCSWVKTAATGTTQVLIQMSRGPSQYDFAQEGAFNIRPDGTLYFWDYYAGTSYGFPTNGSSSLGVVNDGNWHLACFVKDHLSGTYYIDGQASGTTTAGFDVPYGPGNWVIGMDYRDGSGYVNGLLDDFRIYSRSLSASDVMELYTQVGAWKFDEASGTLASDSSGYGNDGTAVGGPSWIAGKKSNALQFGTGTYVSVPSQLISSSTAASGKISGSAWIYADSAAASGTVMAAASSSQFRLGFDGSSGKISVSITQSNGTVIGPVIDTQALPLNAWRAIGFTADGSRLTLYRGGIAVASTTYDGTLMPISNYIAIGASLDASGSPAAAPGYFDGAIDDARIFSTGLSSSSMYSLAHVIPAAPTGVSISGDYHNGFSVTWDAAPSEDDVTSHVVQYAAVAEDYWDTFGATSSASELVTGLAPGPYKFRAAAVNVIGQSEYSSSTYATSTALSYSLGTSCSALQNIATSTSYGDPYGTYTMTGSIDCSGIANFKPITFAGFGFQGTLDGAGYSISNLTIDASSSTTTAAGLFESAYNATVKNLNVSNASVTGYARVGAIAGYASGLTLDDTTMTGSVSCDPSSNGIAGSLVGEADIMNMSGVRATSTVTCRSYYVGGLLGFTYILNMDRSSFSGTVSGDDSVGGLLGHIDNFNGLNISRSYAIGSISGGHDVGGLVGSVGEPFGFRQSTITDSFASTTITAYASSSQGWQNFGGLVGYGGSLVISRSYAAGSVSGDTYVGGLIGQAGAVTITDSFSAASTSASTTAEASYAGAIVGGDRGFGGYLDQNQLFVNDVYDASLTSACNGNAAGPQGGCVGVNTQSDPNPSYFFNTTEASPFADYYNYVWNFAGIWQKNAGDYPTLTMSTSTATMPARFAGGCSMTTRVENGMIYTTKCGVTTSMPMPTLTPEQQANLDKVMNQIKSGITPGPLGQASSTSPLTAEILGTAASGASISSGLSGETAPAATPLGAPASASIVQPDGSAAANAAAGQPVSSTRSAAPAYQFNKNLRKGVTDPDVLKLQQFLNAHGFTVSQSGAGSAGNETSYFGIMTAAAVSRFQEAYAAQILKPVGLSKSTGYFYGSTRAAANSLN